MVQKGLSHGLVQHILTRNTVTWQWRDYERMLSYMIGLPTRKYRENRYSESIFMKVI